MNGPTLPMLAAQLAKLQHMVPHNHTARLTTFNGAPYVEVIFRGDGSCVELTPAMVYIDALREKDKARNIRPKDAGTKQVRTPQTRGSSWR